MAENVPPIAIPPADDTVSSTQEEQPEETPPAEKISILSTPRQPKTSEHDFTLTSSPVANGVKRRKQYRNGYEHAPNTPSYTPYSLRISSGRKRLQAFKFLDKEFPSIRPQDPRSLEQ